MRTACDEARHSRPDALRSRANHSKDRNTILRRYQLPRTIIPSLISRILTFYVIRSGSSSEVFPFLLLSFSLSLGWKRRRRVHKQTKDGDRIRNARPLSFSHTQGRTSQHSFRCNQDRVTLSTSLQRPDHNTRQQAGHRLEVYQSATLPLTSRHHVIRRPDILEVLTRSYVLTIRPSSSQRPWTSFFISTTTPSSLHPFPPLCLPLGRPGDSTSPCRPTLEGLHETMGLRRRP